MNRYSATMFKDGIWNVRHNEHNIIFEGSDAEAHIIAFALNVVAEGRSLQASPLQDEFTGFEGGVATYAPVEYDGPTEGVAPK